MCSPCDGNEYREVIAENVRRAHDRDRQFENLLAEADVLTKGEGWRILLSAHDHVWRDREWEWRTRFDVTALLWNKAIGLCRERIVGRAA